MKSFIPDGYKSLLSVYDTQKAIGLLNRLFEDRLGGELHLFRVSAPLFVEGGTGLNDNLSGVERPVGFDIPATKGDAQVVHSLAKWKRFALKRYGLRPGQGLYANMNAIRRDEELDNLHSIYVDQWDWEKVINESDRTLGYLYDTVRSIASALRSAQDTMTALYPELTAVGRVDDDVSFISAQELEDMYPALSSKERENAYLREHHTAFIVGIGGKLKSGEPHDARAPDYDDWDLNGDLLVWNELLQCAIELSSMGVRVSPESMDRQLSAAGCDYRRELPFHRMLLNGELPLTIGGGIGQSRVSLQILGKAHIGEVQVSVWDRDTAQMCEKAGVLLL